MVMAVDANGAVDCRDVGDARRVPWRAIRDLKPLPASSPALRWLAHSDFMYIVIAATCLEHEHADKQYIIAQTPACRVIRSSEMPPTPDPGTQTQSHSSIRNSMAGWQQSTLQSPASGLRAARSCFRTCLYRVRELSLRRMFPHRRRWSIFKTAKTHPQTRWLLLLWASGGMGI